MYEMTEKAGGATREMLRAVGWTDQQLVQEGLMRRVYGALHVKTTDEKGNVTCQGSRTSINPNADWTAIYRTLEFRDAAARDGRVFLCVLVSPRKAWWIEKLFGVRRYG